MYHKVILENGLRVVAERLPAVKSVSLGIWVDVGSRDEEPGEAGYSHFIEHMFFKGTRKRSAARISREIDALGGELNAFTSRETTTFYVKVLDQHLEQAVDLLADLFHHSRFAADDIEREKQVVLEEIRMVQDDPEDYVQEMHQAQAMPDHPLGRSILGHAGTIQGIRRDRLLRYVGRHYHPSRIVLSVAGNFDWIPLRRRLARAFGTFTRPNPVPPPRSPAEIGRGVQVTRKALEQVHVCLGLKGVSATHRDRYAVSALNAVLGGGVSSRLFQEVREKRGLAYSIYSYPSSYSDAGTLTVYAGTRRREAARVVDLVCREIKRLRRDGLSRAELAHTKNQLKGNLMLGLENSQSRMSKLAKDELLYGRHCSLDEMLKEIDRVTAGQVLRIGRELLDVDRLAVTVLGPIGREAIAAAVP